MKKIKNVLAFLKFSVIVVIEQMKRVFVYRFLLQEVTDMNINKFTQK